MIRNDIISGILIFWSVAGIMFWIYNLVSLGDSYSSFWEMDWSKKQWICVILITGPLIWAVGLTIMPLIWLATNIEKFASYIWRKLK